MSQRFQAFDAALDQVVDLGWAYADALCLETMLDAIDKAPGALRPALSVLARLFGASKVEGGLAFYLAQARSKKFVD